MKTAVLAMVMAALAASAQAGPASTNQFTAPAMRQDLTGQGTYHRLGMLREQDRAVAKVPSPTPTPAGKDAPGESWLARAWRSIFPLKPPQPSKP